MSTIIAAVFSMPLFFILALWLPVEQYLVAAAAGLLGMWVCYIAGRVDTR
jgi:hypothetical protein